MARQRSDSTLARIQTARQNEQLVLAESALRGSQTVAWVRLAMIFAMGWANMFTRWLAGESPMRDPFRGILIAGYTLFALAIALLLRRVKPDPAQATRGQAGILAADLLFVGGMFWRTFQVEASSVSPQFLVIGMALVICLHVASYQPSQLIAATVLALAGYLLLSLHSGTYEAGPAGLVAGG